MKGQVAKCEHREYGFAQVQISKIGENASADALFEGLGSDLQVCSSMYRSSCDYLKPVKVWMSHGDQLSAPPPDFHVIGRTSTAPFAAIAHNSKPFYGIQFHPEVTHSKRGREVIGRFVVNICECKQHWTMVCTK